MPLWVEGADIVDSGGMETVTFLLDSVTFCNILESSALG